MHFVANERFGLNADFILAETVVYCIIIYVFFSCDLWYFVLTFSLLLITLYSIIYGMIFIKLRIGVKLYKCLFMIDVIDHNVET